MTIKHAFLATVILTGCGPNPSVDQPVARQLDVRSGEKIVVFSIEPYQWREDADCYVSKSAFDPNNTLRPRPEALKWRKQRHFSGYLHTNFEAWSFTPAEWSDDSTKFGEGRYSASIYYQGSEIAFAPEPRAYRITFIGREALCNTQRPDERVTSAPRSPNLVIIDRIESQSRVE